MGDGPPRFRRGFSCPAVLRIPARVVCISLTRLSLSLANFSKLFSYTCFFSHIASPTTLKSKLFSLGSSRFARRYSGNRIFFLFLQLLRCFSSLRLPLNMLCIHIQVIIHYDNWVPPFGNPRIKAYLQLPEAYRR